MSNKIKIMIIILLILLVASLLSLVHKKSKTPTSKSIPQNYIGIKYAILKNDYCSCITFQEDLHFSEYDCDSEPSSMPYTGEFYDTYKYNSKDKRIIFKGQNKTPITADVLSWDEDKITLKVLGSEQNKSCSSNGKDIYEYYADSFEGKGSKVLEIINRIYSEDLTIEYWDNKVYCNKKDKEICENTIIISSEDILKKIKKENNYSFTYFRNSQGKIESVMISTY